MKMIVTPAQMRAIDADMIQRQGIPGVVLMEHAAAAVAAVVRQRITVGDMVYVFCGGGNNGGDGISVARQLAMHEVNVKAFLLADPNQLQGDALLEYHMAQSSGVEMELLLDETLVEELSLEPAAVIVDALFGTGLSRQITGRYARMIEKINYASSFTVAVDIPSGIDGYSGAILGTAVRADHTVTFQYMKQGLVFYPGRDYVGQCTVAPIGLPAWYPERPVFLFEQADAKDCLPPRAGDSHKGRNGRGVLCAGSGMYPGAALLASQAALRGGCGLLKVVIPKAIQPYFASCSGAITVAVGEGDQWDEYACLQAGETFRDATAIAIGPGLGQSASNKILLENALNAGKPLVIDADGLNALSREPELYTLLHENVILTPHPGEMARLSGKTIEQITQDPIAVAADWAVSMGCMIILKGAISVIASPKGKIILNTSGNSGLAKGGSGDVLTGILLALLCQGLQPLDAACTGAFLLGCSADTALRLLDTRFMAPMDVVDAIELTLQAME